VNSTYSAFALRLHSNIPIPGLTATADLSGSPDIEVHLCSSPDDGDREPSEPEELIYTSAYTDEFGEPALRVWQIGEGKYLRLDYYDGVRFWLDRSGRNAWGVWPDSSSLENATTYLVGPVLGLLLRLRGVMCLHASAVAFGDRAVAFVGSEGAGKSTTAAALAQRGHAVISDDVVALVETEGRFSVLPAYPHLSLWPDSVKLLYGPDKTFPTLSPDWGKQFLSLAANRLKFEQRSLPLGAIFVLGQRSSDSRAPFFERMPNKEALLSLVTNSFATNLLDPEMRAREFSLLGRLLSVVPIRQLRPPEAAAQISRLCEAIEDECGSLYGQSRSASHSG
jgi:hypothetical protein